MNYIVEGIDRLGKGTLIAGLKSQIGASISVHYEKPLLTAYHLAIAEQQPQNSFETSAKNIALREFQRDSFVQMFLLLERMDGIILDRAHLGEMVYAPRYRGYSGDYVLELERKLCVRSTERDVLILLTSSDMSFIQDDGLSFDFSAKEAEQLDFITAFDRSNYQNKLMIDIALKAPDGTSLKQYAPAANILAAVLTPFSQKQSRRVSFYSYGNAISSRTVCD